MSSYSTTFFSGNNSQKFQLEIPQRQNSPALVMVETSSRMETLVHYFDILRSGDVPVVINSKVPEATRLAIFDRIKASHKDIGESGVILCTSGTTSTPKSYFFPLSRPWNNAKAHNTSLDLIGGEKILFPLPFTHSFGVVVGMQSSLCLNSETFFLEDDEGLPRILELLKEHVFDVVYLTPSLLRQLNKFLRRDPDSFLAPKKVSIGSALLYYEDLNVLREVFPETEIFYTYGLTEMGPRVSTYHVKELGSGGIPIGEPLKDIELSFNGSLKVKSPYAASGLSANFYDTKDSIERIENQIFIRGRQDDTIIYQGINIFPEEVESVLQEKAIEAVIIGISSPHHGEVPVMVIEEKTIVDERELFKHLSTVLPESHIPKSISKIKEFPRTEMGKIKRAAIKSMLNPSS